MDKRISFDEAVELVHTGSTLALGGMTLYRRPMAFVRALLRSHYHNKRLSDLTLLAFTGGFESDLLVGAGMVTKVRSCYFGLEIFGFAPMFTYLANRGDIEIMEETEASLALGLRAKIAGIGFMPGRAWIGTDLPKLRPDVKTILDPYTGEELMAFPAIRSDVTVIHALRADPEGNAQIGDNKAVDEELSLVANHVIITAEEILPELSRADILSPFVSGVILAPNGARPTSCHPVYPMDGHALLSYTEQVGDPGSFDRFVRSWLET